MLLSKEAKVVLNSFNVAYYENLGYTIPMKKASESTRKRLNKDYVYDFKTPIIVKIEDLQNGSHSEVNVLCDYCKKNIITMKYKDYHKRKGVTNKHACVDCAHLKTYETNMLVYNVKFPSQLDEVKKRTAATNIERYGTIAPAQNRNILMKMKMSSLAHYGVENPMQCNEVRESLAKSLSANGTHKTSKQQIYLFNLYNVDGMAKMNYQVSYYVTDICFPEESLVIEYDGGGHRLREILGQLTKEEFDKKEIIRNSVLKNEGYKIIRVISNKDCLPQDDVLLKMLSDAKHYFQTTQHTWCSYDIDKSLLFNAENLNGIPYDFGSLRTIKESDLNNINDINDSVTIEQQTTTKKGA